jgi:predicted CoA-binding protein
MVDDIPGLRRILKTSKVIAVVGLSGDWFRPSYFVAKYMLEHGYSVIPANPKYDAILGQKCYKSHLGQAAAVAVVLRTAHRG